MEGTVQLKYSVDGTTFSTAQNIVLTRGHAWLRPEELGDQQDQKVMGDYEVCKKTVARLVVSLQCDIRQFDPQANPSTGDTLWVFINKLRCAPFVHLYYSGTSIDGFTEFDSLSNTNYLAPADTPDPEYITTDGTRFRDMSFTLQLRKEVSITP